MESIRNQINSYINENNDANEEVINFIRQLHFDIEEYNEFNNNNQFHKFLIHTIINEGFMSNFSLKDLVVNTYFYYMENFCDDYFDDYINLIKERFSLVVFRRSRNNTLNNLMENIINIFNQQNNNNESINNDTFANFKKYSLNEFKELQVDNNYDNICSICKTDYMEDDDTITILPCSIKTEGAKNHHFHTDCIKTWMLNYNGHCPVCKSDYSS